MFFPVGLNWGLFIHYWPAFAVGIAVAYLHRFDVRYLPQLSLKTVVQPVLFLAVLYGVWVAMPVHQYGLPSLVALAFGGLVWFFADLENVLKRIKNSDSRLKRALLEPWIILGAMSYSVYLLHVQAFQFPLIVMRQFMAQENILFGPIVLLATLILCYPFYLLVERRFLSANYQKIHAQALSRNPSAASSEPAPRN